MKLIKYFSLTILALATVAVWFAALTKDNSQLDAHPRPDSSKNSIQPTLQKKVLFEDFNTAFDDESTQWVPDTYPDDGPFSDNGIYFQKQGIQPPEAYRASVTFGENNWLTAELYSRSDETAFQALFAQAADPADAGNKVVRLASPSHTDAVVIRPTHPLPKAYKISLRVGFADFGDGIPGLNGYDNGNESAEPWSDLDATQFNGFYWLSILDAVPRPHNNIWLHHHRKVSIDSCNHFPAWMEIFNGQTWLKRGTRPVMMFVLDGMGQGKEKTGKPFISYAAKQWHPSGEIRAVDSYKPATWYTVSITRQPPKYTLEVSGDFLYGGKQVYSGTIDYVKNGVWHYNQAEEKAAANTIDNQFFQSLGPKFPHWPADTSWPDYFMAGQPHSNFYEGSVYYDDIKLEVLEP